jgi:hypothetical protein
MRRSLLTLLVLALTVVGSAQTSHAANWDVLMRWFESPPTYGPHKHRGCQDCLMPWQPIQSTMHYTVLPPGMHRPMGMRRPMPSIAPRTPSFVGACRSLTACGCGIHCSNTR